MAGPIRFEAATDGLVALGVGLMLIAVYGSWLAVYRTARAAPVGSSPWFALPAWAQIAAGIALSLAGAWGCWALWRPLPLAVSEGLALALRLVGLPLIGAGVGLWFWSRRALGAMMGVSTAAAVQLQAEHHLIQTGPYARVRHPMYLSYWLLLGGLLVAYRTWTPLLLLALMLAAMLGRARREEEALAATFGETWREYAARVPKYVPRWRR